MVSYRIINYGSSSDGILFGDEITDRRCPAEGRVPLGLISSVSRKFQACHAIFKNSLTPWCSQVDNHQ
jgi:hypothetical protein